MSCKYSESFLKAKEFKQSQQSDELIDRLTKVPSTTRSKDSHKQVANKLKSIKNSKAIEKNSKSFKNKAKQIMAPEPEVDDESSEFVAQDSPDRLSTAKFEGYQNNKFDRASIVLDPPTIFEEINEMGSGLIDSKSHDTYQPSSEFLKKLEEIKNKSKDENTYKSERFEELKEAEELYFDNKQYKSVERKLSEVFGRKESVKEIKANHETEQKIFEDMNFSEDFEGKVPDILYDIKFLERDFFNFIDKTYT